MNQFFALMSRMKYINRWGLMRNTRYETLSEHSYDVAVIAHALALIKNKEFGGSVDANKAAVTALFHDVPEILTGDMPTPVKYFSEQTKAAYDQVEKTAISRFEKMLPEDFAEDYGALLDESTRESEIHAIVKAADKISALVKCIEEEKAGNTEFTGAKKATLEKLESLEQPEVKYFLDKFLPAYSQTLDDHTRY